MDRLPLALLSPVSRRSCAVSLALAVVLSAGPALAQQASTVIPPPDEARLRAWAQTVEQHNADLSAIWPTYWPQSQPFILHAPGIGAVFAGAAARGEADFRPGPLPGHDFTFQLSHPLGPPHTIAVQVNDASDLQLMFHEQFHDYQTQTFSWRTRTGYSEFVDLALIPDLAAFVAATDLERRLLAQAVMAPDRAEKRRLVRLYIVLRQTRHNALHPSIGQNEDYHEWIEGTAEYAGIHGSAIVDETGDAEVRRKIVALLETPALDRPGALVTSLFRWRAYGAGAAQAQLLADLGATRWQERVEGGFTLATLLDNAVGRAPNSEALTWIEQNDLPGLTERARQALAAHEPPILSAQDFLTRAPARLIIELPLTPEQAQHLQLSFQSQGMTPLANEALALPDAARFLVHAADGISLSVRDRAVLYEPLASDGVQRITILLPDLTGLEAITPGGGIALNTPQLDLTLPASSQVSRSDQEIRIQVSGT